MFELRAKKIVMSAAAIAFALFAGQGCSAKRLTVVNQPPVIQKGIITFDTDFGTIQPESISVFFWPSGMNESETEVVVKTVKDASANLDQLTVELQTMGMKKVQLEKEFETKQCITTWADLEPGDDPDTIDWVTKWKAPPIDATERASYDSCVSNQDSRRALVAAMDENVSVKQRQSLGVIFKTLDPGYPSKIENYKSISAKGSKLVLRPGLDGSVNVEITLKDFMYPGNTQSTESVAPANADAVTKRKAMAHQIVGARYNVATKLLTFAVPEIDEQGIPTGAMFHFAMERNPDYMGMARFMGDMALVKNGVVQRYGSAVIAGVLRP